MQSSTATVFRALVMLGCLVAIPLAALVGKSLPDMVKGLVGQRWPAGSASAFGSLEEAQRFEPAAPTSVPPSASAGQMGSGWQPPSPPDTPSRPGPAVGSLDSPVIAAGHQSPLGPAPSLVVPAGGLRAVGSGQQQGPVPNPPGVIQGATGPSGPADPARPAGDKFTYIQDRLRRLGATYYLLESWGSREQLYRFYCKVAVGGNSNYTHYFEATDSDPIRAMARVLQQVEAWRAGGR